MVSEDNVKRTKGVLEKLEKTTGRSWSPLERFTDLVEEVGELANAILVEESAKPEKRRNSEVEDSLCDILFDLILLAEHYGIGLGMAYGKMLDRLEERIRNRDFVDD